MPRITHLSRFGIAVVLLLSLVLAACRSAADRRDEYVRVAQQHLEAGRLREAIVEFRNALRADPNSGWARYGLARAYEQVGERGQALAEAIRAADLLPDNVEVQLKAASHLLVSGQFEDAKARALRVLERDQGNVEALMLLGNAHAGLADYRAAIEDVERASTAAPDDPRVFAVMGGIRRVSGDVKEAERAFQNAVKVAPRSADARLALANYYWSTGAMDAAEREVREAAALDPSHSGVRRALVALYLASRRDKEAEPVLRQLASASAPDDPSARLTLAEVLARRGAVDEALTTLEPLLSEDRNFGPATAKAAMIEQAAGRSAHALDRLAAGLKRFPSDAEMLAARAVILLAERRFEDAAEAGRECVKSSPTGYSGHYVEGAARLELGQPDQALAPLLEAARLAPRAPGPMMQLGRLHLQTGQLATALQYAQSAVAAMPDSPLAKMLLLQVQVASGQLDASRKVLAELLPGGQRSAEVQAAAGDVALLARAYDDALAAYFRAQRLDPQLAAALAGPVKVALARGERSQALKLAGDAVTQLPGDPGLPLLAGQAALAAGNDSAAEEFLRKAVAISGARPEAFQALGALYVRQQRLDEARGQYEALASRQPGTGGPATMAAIVQQLQGRRHEAQQAYERVLQAHPNAAVAANNLAMLMLESGADIDVALNHAQTAKRLLPDDPDVTDTLGLAYLRKGLTDQAIRSFEECTDKAPNRSDCWLSLADARAQAGKKAEALAALDRAVKADASLAGSVRVGQIHAAATKPGS